jgi:hypothetical protein
VKEKMIALLEETIEFYGRDNSRRATNGLGYCVYKSPSGNCCAVGRKMTEKDHTNIVGTETLQRVWDRIESPIIKELPFSFWHDLQQLHDKGVNWDMEDPSLLTLTGSCHVRDMRERIANGVYTA